EAVQRGELVPEVADLLGARLEIVAEAIGLILELFLERGLHERRAAQEPDREREEDRDDRHDVVPERDHRSSFRSNSHWRNCPTSGETYSRSGGETTTTAAIANSAAATSRNASRERILGEYTRDTPLASIRISPTRSRTRKVLDIPSRPLSRNSRRLPWLPTATTVSGPFPRGSKNGACARVRRPSHPRKGRRRAASRSRPGACPSRYACRTSSVGRLRR